MNPLRFSNEPWRQKVGGRAALRPFVLCLCSLAGTGCSRPPAPAVTPAPEPRPGYVDVNRYFSLHPAARQLAVLDRDLARLSRRDPAPKLAEAPVPVQADLPGIAAETPRKTPDLKPDLPSARQTVREEFAVERLARPDRAEDGYYIELERLRRRYLEARTEVRADEENSGLAEATRRANEMTKLERKIIELEDVPERRILYTPEQLRARYAAREEARRTLEELRREEIRRLRELLTTYRRQPAPRPEIPVAELERVERRRDEARAAAEAAIDAQEQQALSQLESHDLPSPQVAAGVAVPPADPSIPERLTTGAPQLSPVKPDGDAAMSRALLALRRHRQELRDLIYRDLHAVVRVAAREQGIALLDPGHGAPDRTLELQATIRRMLNSQSMANRAPGAGTGMTSGEKR